MVTRTEHAPPKPSRRSRRARRRENRDVARRTRGLVSAAAIPVCVAVGALIALPAWRDAALVAGIVLGLSLLVWTTPRGMLLCSLPLLAAFGVLRRLSGDASVAGFDVWLFLPPALALGLVAAGQNRPPRTSQQGRISGTVLLLLGLCTLGTLVLPGQGGMTGIVSALYVLIAPVLWFWAGRRVLDAQTVRRLLVVVAMLAAGVAVYGLYQTYGGFAHFEEEWIRRKATTYVSLNVGGTVRPFSTFVAASDYATYLGIGLLVWLVLFARSGRKLLIAVPLFFIGWALLVASSRGSVVLVTAGIGIALAVASRLSVVQASVLAVLMLFGLSLGVSQLSTEGADPSAALLEHQLAGLADPFDDTKSTANIHLDLIANGLRESVVQPWGHGAGALLRGRNTEADPSNIGYAAGIVGVLLYLRIVLVGGVGAYRRARLTRDLAHVGAVLVLVVTAFQWFNGYQYASTPLAWLMLGWLDAEAASRTETATIDTAN